MPPESVAAARETASAKNNSDGNLKSDAGSVARTTTTTTTTRVLYTDGVSSIGGNTPTPKTFTTSVGVSPHEIVSASGNWQPNFTTPRTAYFHVYAMQDGKTLAHTVDTRYSHTTTYVTTSVVGTTNVEGSSATARIVVSCANAGGSTSLYSCWATASGTDISTQTTTSPTSLA